MFLFWGITFKTSVKFDLVELGRYGYVGLEYLNGCSMWGELGELLVFDCLSHHWPWCVVFLASKVFAAKLLSVRAACRKCP